MQFLCYRTRKHKNSFTKMSRSKFESRSKDRKSPDFIKINASSANKKSNRLINLKKTTGMYRLYNQFRRTNNCKRKSKVH